MAPLLVAISGWRGRPERLPGVPPLRAFLLGLTAGAVYFVGTVYWTSTVVATYGNLAMPVAVFAMVLLALYMSLYPALTAMITGHLVRRMGAAGLLFAPAAWVATEYLRGVLFGGFPWVPLGNSQVTVLPIAQLASVVGVYGLSGLVALVNATLAYGLLTGGRSRVKAMTAAAVVVTAVGGWGTWRVADGSLTRQGTPVRVGLVQGNIEQEDKWKAGEARRIFTTYIAMTRDVVRRGAEYVIWPESSTPFTFEGDPVGERAMRDLAREVRVPILFGSDQQVMTAGEPAHYNAAFQLAPDGSTAAVYRKIHLVPFGEYVPMSDWLTFFPPLVQTLAGFAPFKPGDGMVMLPLGDRMTSTAICYEVTYPSLVRDAVLGGSELLTTITNDAWYGHSSAPYQHFAMASMRAIEHGRYLARAANTGISGIIDPYGRIVTISGLFQQVGIVDEVRLLTGRTIYTVIGDAVAYVAMALIAAAMIAARRMSPGTPPR